MRYSKFGGPPWPRGSNKNQAVGERLYEGAAGCRSAWRFLDFMKEDIFVGDRICIVISIINLSTKKYSPVLSVFVLGITLHTCFFFSNSCWVFNTARLTFLRILHSQGSPRQDCMNSFQPGSKSTHESHWGDMAYGMLQCVRQYEYAV